MFSNPTSVTNPLYPISSLHSAVLLGNIDSHPFRAETTLLADTKTIKLKGKKVKTLVSQYTAYLDGRIHEVALDWYAQADDGSVWYLGEDVFNYENGVVADTEGTWLAGKDGPAAMIMPANPQVGDVYRPENIPGFVFEEVTVKSIGQTVAGPHGPVSGAIVTQELHMDGSYEQKVFAPGYGEFSTGAAGDVEALAVAVSADSLPGPALAELTSLSTGAASIFDAALSENWTAASTALESMTTAWAAYQARGGVPELLNVQMRDALDALAGNARFPAVDARSPVGAARAAIDVAQASLDLQLRHRPVVEIDLGRLEVWARAILADTRAGDPSMVTGDIVALEWSWDRVAPFLGTADVARVNRLLADLRSAADAENLSAASSSAARLRSILGGLKPVS